MSDDSCWTSRVPGFCKIDPKLVKSSPVSEYSDTRDIPTKNTCYMNLCLDILTIYTFYTRLISVCNQLF